MINLDLQHQLRWDSWTAGHLASVCIFAFLECILSFDFRFTTDRLTAVFHNQNCISFDALSALLNLDMFAAWWLNPWTILNQKRLTLLWTIERSFTKYFGLNDDNLRFRTQRTIAYNYIIARKLQLASIWLDINYDTEWLIVSHINSHIKT